MLYLDLTRTATTVRHEACRRFPCLFSARLFNSPPYATEARSTNPSSRILLHCIADLVARSRIAMAEPGDAWPCENSIPQLAQDYRLSAVPSSERTLHLPGRASSAPSKSSIVRRYPGPRRRHIYCASINAGWHHQHSHHRAMATTRSTAIVRNKQAET